MTVRHCIYHVYTSINGLILDFAEITALNVAVEKMNTTQAAYTSAQEHYLQASDRAAKVEADLMKIKANLKSLTEKKITMVS